MSVSFFFFFLSLIDWGEIPLHQTGVPVSFAFASYSNVLISPSIKKPPSIWGQVFYYSKSLDDFNPFWSSLTEQFLMFHPDQKLFMVSLPVFPDIIYCPSELIILKGRMMWSDGDNLGPGNTGEIACLAQRNRQGRRSEISSSFI